MVEELVFGRVQLKVQVQVAAKVARLGEPMAGKSGLGSVDWRGDCGEDMSVDEMVSITVAVLAAYWE